MSDVLHREHQTQTQRASNFHHARLHANIEARAEALKPKPVMIQCVEPEPVPIVIWQHPDEVFGPVVFKKEDNRATCQDILKATAGYFGVSMNDLLSRRRQSELSRARHVAMYLCQTLTMRSFPFIGRAVGKRDHSTVIHGVRKVQGQICAGNALVTEAVDHLTKRLSA